MSGAKLSDAMAKGWRSAELSDEAWIYFDLDETNSFNRLDIYPA